MTAEQVLNHVLNYLSNNYGTDYRSSWYVGIASDLNARLFGDHKVIASSRAWVAGKAVSTEHARAVEAHLLNLGHDGGRSGGDHTTTWVYAFRMEPGTVR